MLKVQYTKTLEKGVKRAGKRGLDLDRLKVVIRMLAEEKILPIKYRDHALSGNYSGHRECQVQADWSFIYKKEPPIIIFERTSTHSDLFKK